MLALVQAGHNRSTAHVSQRHVRVSVLQVHLPPTALSFTSIHNIFVLALCSGSLHHDTTATTHNAPRNVLHQPQHISSALHKLDCGGLALCTIYST